MSNNLRSNARLHFKTKKTESLITFSTEISSNAEILSVTTKKDLAASAGSFTIVLGPQFAKQTVNQKGVLLISDMIEPYDLVQIEFKTNESGYKTEMIGVVSRAAVNIDINPSTGIPTRTVVIIGYDLGKIIQDFHLYFNINTIVNEAHKQQNSQILGGKIYFGELDKLVKNTTAKQLITRMLNYFFKETGNLQGGPVYPVNLGTNIAKNTSNIASYIDFVSGISSIFHSHTLADPLIFLSLQPGSETSLWDLIRCYSDKPYHETFVDLRRVNTFNTSNNPTEIKTAEATHIINPNPLGGSTPLSDIGLNQPTAQYTFNQPYVFYMRTTPFSPKNWTNLNYHVFDLTEILHQDTATDSDNIYNYYEVICERDNIQPPNGQISFFYQQSHAKIPIFDIQSISKFGFRKFPMNTTKYVEFVLGDFQHTLRQQAYLMRELFRWFCLGEEMESGSIVLKGRVGIGYDGITIGSKLVESNGGTLTKKEYYIESLCQEFTFGSGLKTTIGVTRGTVYYGPNGRFAKIAALENRYGLNGNFYEDILDDGYNHTPTPNYTNAAYTQYLPPTPGAAPIVITTNSAAGTNPSLPQ